MDSRSQTTGLTTLHLMICGLNEHLNNSRCSNDILEMQKFLSDLIETNSTTNPKFAKKETEMHAQTLATFLLSLQQS